jgi:hypothetical protein
MHVGSYAVVTAQGPIGEHSHVARAGQSGLSHADAMRLAEGLRDDGQIATVVHVVDGKSHEVDRYPAR